MSLFSVYLCCSDAQLWTAKGMVSQNFACVGAVLAMQACEAVGVGCKES